MLGQATKQLGIQLRRFVREVCKAVRTFETAKETAARARRVARAQARGTAMPAGATAKKEKTFNLRTFKFHALGYYQPDIPMFGTSDSYSTQTVRIN